MLFTGATRTACGVGQAAMGPFYRPADQKVYIDLAFYQELKPAQRAGRLRPGLRDRPRGGPPRAEPAGHLRAKVQAARQRAGERYNALSVRLELQADVPAGVWAKNADAGHRGILEAATQEGRCARPAIGDDTLQKQAQGYAWCPTASPTARRSSACAGSGQRRWRAAAGGAANTFQAW